MDWLTTAVRTEGAILRDPNLEGADFLDLLRATACCLVLSSFMPSTTDLTRTLVSVVSVGSSLSDCCLNFFPYESKNRFRSPTGCFWFLLLFQLLRIDRLHPFFFGTLRTASMRSNLCRRKKQVCV